jgi:methanogenic corrinoid protein MtbC1
MQRHLAAGLAAAEAARLAVEIRADTDRAGTTVFDAMAARAELGAALEHFDEPAAQAVFDRVLAVATLDSHDIGLVAFGLALHARGWRIHFLGADTPIQSIADAARSLSPDLVVLAASRSDTLDGVSAELEELGLRHRVAVGGAGVRAFRAPEHVLVLGDGPVAAAEHASALF